MGVSRPIMEIFKTLSDKELATVSKKMGKLALAEYIERVKTGQHMPLYQK